jgi:hypothetical protein
MQWQISSRFEPHALSIANRHYNRQTPDSPQFVPPGRCLVLTSITGSALWVSSWPVFASHAWRGAWINVLFRRESGPLASQLIREALAATSWWWGFTPYIQCPHCNNVIAMVTFIDAAKIRPKRDPGRCYLRAGFVRCPYRTKKGFLTLHLPVTAMPAAEQSCGTMESLFT